MSRLTIESADVVAQEAEAEILRITESWEKRPTRITRTSAVKLVLAHFRKGAAELAIGALNKPLMAQNAQASWADLREARDDMGDCEQTGTSYALRCRLKDLEFLFGSPKNVHKYMDGLKMDAWQVEMGKKPKVFTETRHSRSKISWKEEHKMLKLLYVNLGRPVVQLKNYMTCISPVEFAELIGLKLALEVLHEATEVEEVAEFEFNMRRTNKWLERRCNMPQYEGDLNAAQLALPVEDRYCDDFESGEYITTRGRIGLHADDVDIVEERDVNTRFTPLNSYEIEERYGRSGAWVISDTTGKPVRHRVSVTGGIKFKALPKWDETDWDSTHIFIKDPSVYSDRTQPRDENDEFPQMYEGPSFVVIRNGLPAKPEGRCEMHDGMLWYRWSQGGKVGECPTCQHMHLRKPMIRKDHWYPKAKLVREYTEVDEDGIMHIHEKVTKLLADPAKMSLVSKQSKLGKSSKWELKFDHSDMTMALMVPEFRRAIEHCVEKEIFACAPLLEEKVILKRDGSDPWRHVTWHVFLPMTHMKYLFNLRTLPLGWEDMAIRVQMRGHHEHLIDANKASKGLHLRTTYRIGHGGQWVYDCHEWVKSLNIETYYLQYVDMTVEELSNLFD